MCKGKKFGHVNTIGMIDQSGCVLTNKRLVQGGRECRSEQEGSHNQGPHILGRFRKGVLQPRDGSKYFTERDQNISGIKWTRVKKGMVKKLGVIGASGGLTILIGSKRSMVKQ
jgi:hypothetical protein